MGIVTGAYREEQQVVITDLEHLLENEIDMNTTVIVGNSQTFSFNDFMVTPRGYQKKYNLGGGGMMNIPRMVLAGTSSGVGKTTIATGLVAAIKSRGHKVQPFKCGPDYIDPGYLALAAEKSCHNLDSWMLPAESLLEIFVHASAESGMAVVEGVMGLYDGQMASDGAGSTAEVAKILKSPVILVIDVARMSQSAAAIAMGYRHLDTELTIAGVILNRVGSARHLRFRKKSN